MRGSLFLSVLATGTILVLLTTAILASADPVTAGSASSHEVVLLADNFDKDTALNTTEWMDKGTALTDLAAASSSPGSTFVAPKLTFVHSKGMRMSGPTGDYQFSGIASRSTFGLPLNLAVSVTANYGCADVFSIYLTNSDLSDYAAVFGNFPSTNGPYYGVWATYSPTYHLYQFGPQLYSTPGYNITYVVKLTVPAKGNGSVSLWQKGVQIGVASLGQIGKGPFRVTLAQRIGLPYCSPVPMRATWHSVKLSREDGTGTSGPTNASIAVVAQVRRIPAFARI